ncbi:DUF4334 domain-containing protein [Rhodoferax saidenbachensis]|uniref:DUF4334 domain-containing protein n=1 Tax=Rhodoferax saidenbachensis TaxID=1484693 RepID=A0A1P8KB73_9BURK|nr:DUF4334 domain-containing protein [Rhodoferax saidenbachensis]APW43260.1 hypothetical protein RS694_12480 [Rhodoferax saidenbachensis]
MNVHEKLNAGGATTQEALALFDALSPVETDFMLGSWKGEGFETGHPMDGLLEAYHWYGKRFESAEDVHPLVFSTLGGGLASVNPARMGPALSWSDHVALPKSATLGRVFQAMMPLFTTTRSRARLRMTSYRGQSSATMVYDQLPINDVFRKIDANAVFGVMDRKGMQKPFFFILRRVTAGH